MTNVIYGTASAEYLFGNNEKDIIYGRGGADDIFGFGGDDTLYAAPGSTLRGGAGNDTYMDTTGGVSFYEFGGEGLDTLMTAVNMASDLSFGLENIVNLLSGSALTLMGNSANNFILGGQASDAMYGRDGNDTIEGSDVNPSSYYGEEGNDRLIGGAKNDFMSGGNGHDILEGRGSTTAFGDQLDGGAGNDTYILAGDTTAVITDASGIDTITSTISRDLGSLTQIERLKLLGTSDLSGVGNGLANLLVGNSGANTLSGLGGTDVLTGGKGRDVLRGGALDDTFDFNAVSDSGKTAATRDRITDFSHGHDEIDLSTIDANSTSAGNQAFSFVAAAGSTFSGARGQLIWRQENNGGTANDKTIIAGDINGDRIADFEIELKGLKLLTAGDFIL